MANSGGSGSNSLYDVAAQGGDACSLLVSLPLLVPYGVVVKQDTSSSAAYAFSQQFPSARALLSRSSETCDMFVGQLQVDLVSFSCKRSQVAQVAAVFNRMARKKLSQHFNRPIYIRCEGLKQRSVSAAGVGGSSGSTPYDVFIGNGQQRVYFTAVDVLTAEDREKFWLIEGFVEAYVEKLREMKLLNLKTLARTPDLFVVVRRFLSDPLPHPLSHYDKYACDGVQLSEVRLVFSKGTSQCPVKHVKIDPRFKNFEVSCRPIVCDNDAVGMVHSCRYYLLGRPARHEFASALLPPVFPSANAAASYLDSLDANDEKELRELVETEISQSGSSDADTVESTVESSSVYSPGIPFMRDPDQSPPVNDVRERRRVQRSTCPQSVKAEDTSTLNSSAVPATPNS